MAPEVARRCEFLAGLYVTLGYRQAERLAAGVAGEAGLGCVDASGTAAVMKGLVPASRT
ncbi:hypothetical protein ACFV19_23920 [Streptomyces griseoluteus]|uniref:hypothetical protein n=1 Tax=Streptomyces griseoluteus TaxID=29306 RepID=UPI0036C332E7